MEHKTDQKISGLKTTHGKKMFQKFNKQIKNINIHRPSILQNCLFMYLIFVPFETVSVK